MKLTFEIDYRANWGDTLCIVHDNPAVSNGLIEMSCHGESTWRASMKSPAPFSTYHYAVRTADGMFMHEAGPFRTARTVLPGRFKCDITLRDSWQVPDSERVFGTSLFKGSLFKRTDEPAPAKTGQETCQVMFRLFCPQVRPGQGVAVMGSTGNLGNWNRQSMVHMTGADFPFWTALVEADASAIYKYVIYDRQTGVIDDLESGQDRSYSADLSQPSLLICNDYGFRRTSPKWKAAGTAIPVFSLRSKSSFGIGEFADLAKLGRWAAMTGQKMIQTLPVNDTTLRHDNHDSYPYNAVSVFALNPNYVNIASMGSLKGKAAVQYRTMKEEFESKGFADYQAVADAKSHFFHILYRQDSKRIFKQRAYQAFFKENQGWLVPYAVFSVLRDMEGTACFSNWSRYSVYDRKDIERLAKPGSEIYDQVAYHYYIQYFADKQLKEARLELQSLGIGLKGDIPIGISPDSVEAWTSPELFDLKSQTGAPPDFFSVSGQNWGFPTYNWDVMARDNYDWFCRRFRKMADYFDAYRIDHILGFFRIWKMPLTEVWGLAGQFSPALPYSLGELRELGIDLPADRLTKPYITDDYLPEIFGTDTDYVKKTFLNCEDGVHYSFKEKFNTQRKVQAWFSTSRLAQERKLRIRDGLYLIHCEVLFVRDMKNGELLHPRVSLFQSHSFAALEPELQDRLRRLHDDFFYTRHNEFWKESAMKKLPVITQSTDMLVCGEDLGMVPASVPQVMKQLNILSLEIQRMPKGMVEFGLPSESPYLSVCTTSSHDTNPLRAWWEEDSEKTQRYFENVLHMQGQAPAQCTPEIVNAIIGDHLASPAMLVILPLQDWLALDPEMALPDAHAERINVPDNPENFWCYRMHLNIEDLIAASDFNASLSELISGSGR